MAVADHQGPRSESLSQLPGEFGDPPAQRVEKRPVEYDTRIPGYRKPIAVESGHPGGIALSDYEKAEALAKSFEAQFQLVTDP